jgi:hypothetical protein
MRSEVSGFHHLRLAAAHLHMYSSLVTIYTMRYVKYTHQRKTSQA